MSDTARLERAAQARQVKRFNSMVRKCGACVVCVHREQTRGVFHCRNNEVRAGGACNRDGCMPKFKFDDAAMKQFADAT